MIKVCLEDGFSPANCPRFKLTIQAYVSKDGVKKKGMDVIFGEIAITKVSRNALATLKVLAVKGA
jgi:hypothetical protein